MQCQHLTFSGRPCGNPIKKYNACGVHKKSANWITDLDKPQDQAIFSEFQSRYVDLMKHYRDVCNCLESKGINILGVQRAYGFNLYQKPNLDLLSDPDEIEMVKTLITGVDLIAEYQNKLDPFLISNAATIIHNQILE